jgi:hypothetical protein
MNHTKTLLTVLILFIGLSSCLPFFSFAGPRALTAFFPKDGQVYVNPELGVLA